MSHGNQQPQIGGYDLIAEHVHIRVGCIQAGDRRFRIGFQAFQPVFGGPQFFEEPCFFADG